MKTVYEYTESVTKRKSILQVYGKELSDIQTPLEYVQESFEPPRYGVHKHFLNIFGRVESVEACSRYSQDEPRIILKKQPYYRMKTGVQPRLPKIGDYIVNKLRLSDNDDRWGDGWIDTMLRVSMDFVNDKHFVFEKVED